MDYNTTKQKIREKVKQEKERKSGVNDGARTHDPQNHNLML